MQFTANKLLKSAFSQSINKYGSQPSVIAKDHVLINGFGSCCGLKDSKSYSLTLLALAAVVKDIANEAEFGHNP